MSVGYLAHGFDLLNVADLDLVAQARRRCGWLLVGVLSDELVERLSGRAPVVPLTERIALVAHLRGVDEVRVHRGDDSDLPPGAVLFAAAGHAAALPAAEVVPLVPARESTSPVVRAALRPFTRVA